jgi:hypothetical protein
VTTQPDKIGQHAVAQFAVGHTTARLNRPEPDSYAATTLDKVAPSHPATRSDLASPVNLATTDTITHDRRQAALHSHNPR